MQLIAVDDAGLRVIAPQAEKQKNYRCPQCDGILRLRHGTHVQPHFYHYQQVNRCSHRKKSLAHLYNQLYLAKALPLNEAILEHPFPAIERIADVFWPAKGIVFEVQCSPMTLEEAQRRESDYRSLGLELVWILHDKRYNRRRLCAAEHFFSVRNTYYTSISVPGSGKIYDQFAIIRDGKRYFKGAQFPISPSDPSLLSHKQSSAIYPDILLKHWEKRTLSFAGDLLDRAFKNPDYDYSSLIALENRYAIKKVPLLQTLATVYRAFLYALLEKIC